MAFLTYVLVAGVTTGASSIATYVVICDQSLLGLHIVRDMWMASELKQQHALKASKNKTNPKTGRL